MEKAFLDLLTKPPEENKAQIMGVDPGISNFDMDAYIDRNVQMLVKQGLLKGNIKTYKLDQDTPPSLDEIDVLLMLGSFIPGIPENLSKLVPSYYVTQTLTNVFIRGANATSASSVQNLGVLGVYSLVVIVLGIVLYNRNGS